MVKKCCSICRVESKKEENDDENDKLYQVPKQTKRRQLWSEACGQELGLDAVICGRHFKEDDYHVSAKNTRSLKSGAIPSLYLNPKRLMGFGEDDEQRVVSSPLNTFLECQIKLETNGSSPNEIGQQQQPPPALIDEELFDQSSVAEKIVAINPVIEIVTCGQVQYKIQDKNSFYLSCVHCSIEYAISEWQAFIRHIKEDHPSPAQGSVVTDIKTEIDSENEYENRACSESSHQLNKESESDNAARIPRDQLTLKSKLIENFDENSVNYSQNRKRQCNDGVMRSNSDASDGSNSEPSDGDEEGEEEDNDMELKCSSSGDKVKKLKKKKLKIDIDQISFESTDSRVIKDFLELVKKYPILWHRRLSIKKMFDAAMAKLVSEFNAKHQLTLTDQALTMSLTRMKAVAKRPTFESKYPQYKELWDEIRQAGESLTYNCDKCESFFFTEVDLQTHKAKRHRIGELPFKCKTCKFGFSNAEKCAEHEKRHLLFKAKRFVCEICQKGFAYEFHLKTHMPSHVGIVCEVCGEVFTSRMRYKKHKIKHEPPKEKCDICDKAYYDKWVLSEHVKSHLNRRNYKCELCGTTFNQQQGLRIHLRNVHQTVLPKPRLAWVNKNEVEPKANKQDNADDNDDGDDDDDGEDYDDDDDGDGDDDDDDDNHVEEEEGNECNSTNSIPMNQTHVINVVSMEPESINNPPNQIIRLCPSTTAEIQMPNTQTVTVITETPLVVTTCPPTFTYDMLRAMQNYNT